MEIHSTDFSFAELKEPKQAIEKCFLKVAVPEF